MAPSDFDTGHSALAFSASSWNFAASMPGTLPTTVSALPVIPVPGTSVTTALASSSVGGGAVLGQEVRELHGEAAGMRGGDEFLRIGAGLAAFILEPRLERVRRAFQGPALRVERAVALFQIAFPDGVCGAVHEVLLDCGG